MHWSKKLRILWLFVLISPLYVWSQNITGTINDSLTNRHVEFAAVYVNGTTIGTVSDKNGTFSLQLQTINFPCQIIVSHVSYRTKVISIDENSILNLTISVAPKIIELNQVTIMNKSLRNENIEHFKAIFLGSDKWGKNAILTNDSVLVFKVEYFCNTDTCPPGLIGKPKIFKVESTAPIQIDLPLLGYDLRYDLVNFDEEFNPDLNAYFIHTLGYYFYKTKEAGSKAKENKYKRNRLKAYYYSPQHFTRSLYSQKLPENGYYVYEIVHSDVTNKILINKYIPDSCLTYTSEGAIIKGLSKHCFYINYYSDFRDFPINMSKTTFYDQSNYSEIYFLHDTCVIRKDGTRPENSIVFGPGIGSKRVGATLPNDYEPVK
jgi:hypothetical protein